MFWLVSVLTLLLPPIVSQSAPARTLSFEERVAAQVAIDRVQCGHRAGGSCSRDEAAEGTLARSRVRTWMLQEAALDRFADIRITVEQLDGELDRIAAGTAMPGRLAEIFSALGNDRLLVREALVRPLLVDRLLRRHHADDGARHAAALQDAHALAADLSEGRLSVSAPDRRRQVLDRDPHNGEPAMPAGLRPEVTRVEETMDSFLVSVRAQDTEGRPIGLLYRIPKEPFDDWWREAVGHLADADLPAPLDGGNSSPLAGLCLRGDVWIPTSQVGAPSPRSGHTAVWTGTEMIVWGGGSSSGGRYDPVTDSWRGISTTGAPGGPNFFARAVWTGDRMVVWGETGGGVYDPVSDTWSPMSLVGAPTFRQGHTLVWTGSRVIVWGGREGAEDVASGALYDPAADSWMPTSTAGAPSPREQHTATWTGNRMVVWGGACRFTTGFCSGTLTLLNTGGIYDPATDSWIPTSMTSAAPPRIWHSAVWTGQLGQQLLIWGGSGSPTGIDRFYPPLNRWLVRFRGIANEPSDRFGHVAVWTGDRMLVWGGRLQLTRYVTGGKFDLLNETWSPTSLDNVLAGRDDPTMVWADGVAIVWGGNVLPGGGPVNDGRLYSLSTEPDADGDNWTISCDCDDADASTYPGAPDLCDGLNNDCRHPGWPDVTGVDRTDEDHDGWPICAGDCDDQRGSVSPNQPEACDGLDNDCDGVLPPDELDADHDGWSVCGGDCSDSDSASYPDADEACDGLDNDCDGALPPAELDGDHDGWTPCDGDCSDVDPASHPGGVELPGNLRDENCDGQVLCDPTATWQNQGAFMTCVTRAVNDLVQAGLITREEGTQLIRRSARLSPG